LLHTLLAPKIRGDTLAWVVDAYNILGIHRLQTLQEVSFHLEANQHLPQHFTRYSIKCLFEVHKATIKWFLFFLAMFYQSLQYEKLISSVVIFAKPNLTLGMQPMLFNPLTQPFVNDHSEQLY
jgi:hypothetical protein